MRRTLSRATSALLLASLLALPMTASANPAFGSGAGEVAQDSGGYLGSGNVAAAEDSGYFGSGHLTAAEDSGYLGSGHKDGGTILVSGGLRGARAAAVSALRTLLRLRLGWM
jgi:hypothetical protein